MSDWEKYKQAFLESFISQKKHEADLQFWATAVFDKVNGKMIKNHKHSIENSLKLTSQIDGLSSKFNDITPRLFDIESKVKKIIVLESKISSLQKTIKKQEGNIKQIENHIKETYLAQLNCDIKRLESKYQSIKEITDAIQKTLPDVIGKVVGETISTRLYQTPLMYYPQLTN